MTTFTQIHDNADGYRKDYTELKNLCLQVAEEKGKGDPVVSWFRLRNRRTAQILDPMKEEIEARINKEEQNIEEADKGLSNIKKAKQAAQNNQIRVAQRLIDESGKLVNDLKLSSSDESLDQLSNAERELSRIRSNAVGNISSLKKASQNVDQAKDLFVSTQKAKEIDHEAFSSAINTINNQKNKLDIDVPYLKEVPPTYDNSIINNLHEAIRAVVKRIDSRHPMRLFSSAIQTNRTIIHDVGNDRGRRAFTNRAGEIDARVNEAIEAFNSKYWQITGQRWERIGTNTHGYRYVGSTHSRIKTI